MRIEFKVKAGPDQSVDPPEMRLGTAFEFGRAAGIAPSLETATFHKLFERNTIVLQLTIMKRAIILLPLPLFAFSAMQGCSAARAQSPEERSGDPREGIELVVYSSNFAMVSENRTIDLPNGTTTVRVAGVSRMLNQDSVIFSFPTNPDARAASSTYDLGMDSSEQLLTRFLGQKVTLVYRGDNGQAGERQEGTLEVAQPGNVVVRVGDKFVVNPQATIEAPAGDEFATIPQLSAEIVSSKAGKSSLNVAYLTEGLSWSADYTLILPQDPSSVSLDCWASIVNKSGADYPNARISFVAGSPNRAAVASQNFNPSELKSKTYSERAPKAEMPDMDFMMRPQAAGELHAYPYESTATVRQNQTNRVLMMNAGGVKAERDYAVRLPTLNRWYAELDPSERHQAVLSVNMTNSKGAGLGQPLPAGSVRVYEPSSKGAPTYIGASAIADTPKDGKIHLTLSEVFDVYSTAKLVSKRALNKRQSEYKVEAVIHNEKPHDLDIRVVQDFSEKFKFASQSVSGKSSPNSSEWRIHVPAGGETKLIYTLILG